ncbi:MAG TPA: HAD hydrolase-like protein [Candidatus Paceibacterota bacterium]|nr:HAD hydrolase-like protein [Candidatus Paceibacterota bacterium]
MLKNIILDFDGVIADTFDVGWALAQEHDEDATLEKFLAHHDGNVFEEPQIKFKPERLPEFNAEYRRRVQPGHIERAREPIMRLGATYSLFVVSSNSEHGIAEVLKNAGVLHLFVRIMGLETHRSKVEKFKILMAENGVTPENTLFVTDTLGDIKEAEKVGIRTIAETFGFHDRERLAQGNPFRIADSWDEIEQIIEEDNSQERVE